MRLIRNKSGRSEAPGRIGTGEAGTLDWFVLRPVKCIIYTLYYGFVESGSVSGHSSSNDETSPKENEVRRWVLSLGLVALFMPAFAAHAGTYEIEGLDSLRFSVENITVEPGEEVTIKLINKTELPAVAMAHNWVLLVLDADPQSVNAAAATAKKNDYIPQQRKDEIIAYTDLVAGGETATVTFTAPSEPGDYPYVCTFPGHFAAGMKGTLTVTGG